MSHCSHPATEPVYAYLHRPLPQAGDQVMVANDGQPVARICTSCRDRLPVEWGCADCEWIEAPRRLGDLAGRLELAAPCELHRGGLGDFYEARIVDDHPDY